MFDLLTVVALIFLNAFIVTSGFAFFTALGNYWVRRQTPQWLTGPGFYCHKFLDGLEYSLTRTALAAGMARNILVLKCLPKTTAATGKFKAETTPAQPVASPPLPDLLKQALDVFKQVQLTNSEAEEESIATVQSVVPIGSTTTTTATTTKKLRSRSRIVPPTFPVAANPS